MTHAKSGGAPAWLWPLVFAAVTLALRGYLFHETILNIDEAMWVTSGECLKAGWIPYREVYDMKPPGLLYLYVLGAMITPWSVVAARVFAAIAIWLTACFLWSAARTVDRPFGGILAALLYILVTAGLPRADFHAAESEVFVAAASAAGFACLVNAVVRDSVIWALGWGLAGLVAINFKQPGILDFVGMTAGLGSLIVFGRQPLRGTAKVLAAGIAGGLFPGVALLAMLAAIGALDDMVFYCFTYGRRYFNAGASAEVMAKAWLKLAADQPFLFFGGVIAIPISVLRLRRAANPSAADKALAIAGCWLLAAYAGAISGRHPWPHYYYQVIPASAWLLGVLLTPKDMASVSVGHWSPGRKKAIALAVVVLTALPGLHEHVYFDVVRPVQPAVNPVTQMGEWLRAATSPDESIFIWGFQMDGYYTAKRMPATGDITCQFCSGWAPLRTDENARSRVVERARIGVMEDLRRRRPAYVLDCSRMSFVPIETFPDLTGWLAENYRLVPIGTDNPRHNPVPQLPLYERRDRTPPTSSSAR